AHACLLAIGSSQLALRYRTRWAGVVLDVAFDGVLAFDLLDVEARCERALRLADARIALQIALGRAFSPLVMLAAAHGFSPAIALPMREAARRSTRFGCARPRPILYALAPQIDMPQTTLDPAREETDERTADPGAE